MAAHRSGRALVVREPGEVVLEDRTVEAGGGLLVEPYFVGLCGTDLEIIRGDLDPAYTRYPLVLGHEWSGRVVEAAGGFAPGDPVVVEGVFPCSVCGPCREGRTNMCANYEELGFTLDGAAGPAVAAPAHLVHRLCDDVPLAAGALVEPAAVVLRALTEIDIAPGSSVLVIGDGTVGLLAAQLARMWSPASVAMAGRRPAQETLATTAAGVDDFTVDVPNAEGYDVVVEAAGSTVAVENALRAARPGGQVLLLGIAGHGRSANLLVDDVVNKDLRIRGSFSYTAAAWATTVRLLNSGRFRPLPLVTHRLPLDRYSDALDLLATPSGEPRGKILIEMKGTSK
ncbi:zinc-dependent alcohol dehydrogenase [Pseudonocardia acaciae]|uniref:zinc-dependent alcohol dehydrogenase n=1 Tax=Pseudonocardia acaciae TaxID=551276 RepID=UPI00055ECF81|nr:alcohol dehydrogenase catalytic domain-containing protein [Pseudonocardia acaciae]